MRKLILHFLLVVFTSQLGFSQSPYLDSLYNQYETRTGTTRFQYLIDYCSMLSPYDLDKADSLLQLGKNELASTDSIHAFDIGYLNGKFADAEATFAQYRGDFSGSLEKYQECLTYAEQTEGVRKETLKGTAYHGMGIHYGMQGIFDRSTTEFLKAKDAFKLANQPSKQADALAMIGQNYAQLEKFDSVVYVLNQALGLLDSERESASVYRYTFFKANAFNDLGKPDSTIALIGGDFIEKAKTILPGLDGHLIFALSDAYTVKKQFGPARELLKKAKKILDETGENQLEYNYLASRVKLERAAKNYEAAFEALANFKIYEDSIHRSGTDTEFMNLQSKYDAQGKEIQIQKLESEAKNTRNLIWGGGILFLLSLLTGFLWLRNISQKKKTTEALAAKELEVIQTKERLFTNITHELRTPLSLIIDPLREIEAKEKDIVLKKKASLALDNSQQLETLVDQILDWHSLDSKLLKNAPYFSEVRLLTEKVLQRFDGAAKKKKIKFISNLPQEEGYGKLDFEKFEKVINNLISNAIKYSPSEKPIHVDLLLKNDQLHFQIKDQGKGIPINQQKEIFGRFSKGDPITDIKSSGIGLSIVKELIELMEGEININSDVTKGTSITVILPFEKTATSPSSKADVIPTKVSNELEKTLIFLVEDNFQLRNYLAENLEETFEVESFASAEDAEKALLESVPDIIILDVMLPGIDGVEFCEKIKSNTCINHIPVMMLTAKPMDSNKMEALQVGADAWMKKPFKMPELMVQIQNLLTNRKILQEKYNRQITFGFEKDQVEVQDDFLQNLTNFIAENISNDQLAIDDLVKVSGFNRKTMSRKIKALTDKTPVQFVKSIRLEKAKCLLKKNGKNISEIAFEVGFKDPNYFSSSFREYFGYAPSEIKKTLEK